MAALYACTVVLRLALAAYGNTGGTLATHTVLPWAVMLLTSDCMFVV